MRSPPPVYPIDVPLRNLGTAEALLTTSLRLLARVWCVSGEPQRDWQGGLLAAGLATDAVCALDRLFAIAAVARRRPIEVRALSCRTLGQDEGRLLQIISLFQHERSNMAIAALGEAFLPIGQRQAAASVKTLAEAMAAKKLIVPWRHAEAAYVDCGHYGESCGMALVQ